MTQNRVRIWVKVREGEYRSYCGAGLGALRKPNPRNVSEPDTDIQAGGGRNTSGPE